MSKKKYARYIMLTMLLLFGCNTDVESGGSGEEQMAEGASDSVDNATDEEMQMIYYEPNSPGHIR